MKISVLTIVLVVLPLWVQSTSSAQESAQREGIQVTLAPRQENQSFPSSYQAGGVQVAWIAHYSSGEGNHESSALVVDQSGNIYVAGKNDLAGRLGDQFDYIIIKYDNTGTEQWIVKHGTSGPEEPMSIAADNSGNVYIHGRSQPSYYDYLTIKYNSSGVQQWVKIYDGPSHTSDLGKGMALDVSGNVYITGWSMGLKYPVVGSDFDFATIKYNSAGAQQWIARYDGSQRTGSVQIITDDRGHYIAVDHDGKVYVAGTTGNNICTIKLDAQGVQEWIKSYTGPGVSEDTPVGITLDLSGNIYVAGTTEGYGTDKDIVAIKYNTSGVEQWISRYCGSGDDTAYDMISDASGNVYVCGISRVSDRRNLVVVKFSSNGTLDWYALHDTTDSYANSGKALAMDTMGNIYVTGYSQMQASSYDYLTIKYNSSGQQQWAIHYDNNKGFEWANDIGIDGNGGVIVTGYEVSANGNKITTIKYSQSSVAVEQDDANEPSSFHLSQNYPNPFNPETVISFHVPKSSNIVIEVYNLLGQRLQTLVDERKNIGIYQVVWDGCDENGNSVGSGIYIYKMQADGFVSIKKMALVR